MGENSQNNNVKVYVPRESSTSESTDNAEDLETAAATEVLAPAEPLVKNLSAQTPAPSTPTAKSLRRTFACFSMLLFFFC